MYDYPLPGGTGEVETNPAGLRVAHRFELIIEGMEIANGYRELRDPREQRRRFEQDLENTGKATGRRMPICSMPLNMGCQHAGVALGLTVS